jgi:hypothetical protein
MNTGLHIPQDAEFVTLEIQKKKNSIAAEKYFHLSFSVIMKKKKSPHSKKIVFK